MNYAADPCPCRFCKPPERYPGCHDKCTDKYIPWRARLDARKDAERGERVCKAYAAEANIRNAVKIAKYKQSRRTYFKGYK